MDVRIGITHTPKELEVEMPDDADRDKVVADIEKAYHTPKRSGSDVGAPGVILDALQAMFAKLNIKAECAYDAEHGSVLVKGRTGDAEIINSAMSALAQAGGKRETANRRASGDDGTEAGQ